MIEASCGSARWRSGGCSRARAAPACRPLPSLPQSPCLPSPKPSLGRVGKRPGRRAWAWAAPQPAGMGSGKTHHLIGLVADVETIVVPTEAHALILEANLIKEYRPRFNIALRDDKSYPYIKVTVQEPFPRVYVTRRLEDDGAQLLRAVHRRRSDAPRAQRREADLHGAELQLRHAGADARAAVPRLLHQALQGAVHPGAVAARLPGDDRRGGALSRRAARRSRAPRHASGWTSRPSSSTSSAPPSCAMRCTTSSRWRSRPSCSRSRAAIATCRLRARRRRRLRRRCCASEAASCSSREHRFLENIDGEEDTDVLSVYLAGSYVGMQERARQLLLPFDFEDRELLEQSLADTQDPHPAARPAARADRLSPSRTRVTCSRSSSSRRWKPTSARAIPCTSCSASLASSGCRARSSASTSRRRREPTRSARASGSRTAGRSAASTGSSR